MTDQIRYLSPQWIEAAGAATAADTELNAAADGFDLGVTQVVNGGPNGDVVYSLQLDDGRIRLGFGAADPEDFRLIQDWTTAVRVASDRLNAQAAFVGGLITIEGNINRLIAARPVFAALDHALSPLRARTAYPESY